MSEASPFWMPHVHADRRQFLRLRNKIAAELRGYFSGEDFVEVDPSILQISPGNEAHISAFVTAFEDDFGQKHPFYLHSSPEFACKKLLAAGEERIFSFAHCFRNRERGPLHHPEFTMLEWYRAHQTYDVLMLDCEAMLRAVAEVAGASHLTYGGKTSDVGAAFERLSVVEAFERYAEIDLSLSLDGAQTNRAVLAAMVANIGMRVSADDTWSDLFSKVLSEKIEPNLGLGRPTFLYDYPVSEAALARVKSDNPMFSERFELYACGVELANGFGELTDAKEQRRRFAHEMDERQRLYEDSYPLDEDFLRALSFMPQASGIALGFDRLVMLVCGAPHIEQVLWTPVAKTGA